MNIAHIVADGFARLAEHMNDPRISDELTRVSEAALQAASTTATTDAADAALAADDDVVHDLQPDPFADPNEPTAYAAPAAADQAPDAGSVQA